MDRPNSLVEVQRDRGRLAESAAQQADDTADQVVERDVLGIELLAPGEG